MQKVPRGGSKPGWRDRQRERESRDPREERNHGRESPGRMELERSPSSLSHASSTSLSLSSRPIPMTDSAISLSIQNPRPTFPNITKPFSPFSSAEVYHPIFGMEAVDLTPPPYPIPLQPRLTTLQAPNSHDDKLSDSDALITTLRRAIDYNSDLVSKKVKPLVARNREIEESLAKLQGRNGELEERVRELEERVNGLGQERGGLREDVRRLGEEKAGLVKEKEVLQQEKKQLSNENIKLQQEAATLNEQNSGLQKEAATLKGEKEELQKQTTTLQSQNASMRADVERLTQLMLSNNNYLEGLS